ncbi:hypothetical protein [Halobacterium salinarum]|uniref:hypothetical protein n=1 Tax=Halobacterium salinarum TaxID=2242 RepID=UPI001F23A606|nr:hypothetical protein [Halobacterium salinarum]
MSGSGPRKCLVVGVCVLIAGLVVPAGGVAAQPAVAGSDGAGNNIHAGAPFATDQALNLTTNLTVAGTPLPDGGSVTTADNPRLAMNVTSNATIEVISVRINDNTRRSYVPNATAFNESTRLDLDAGTHDLTTVVRTANGTTTYTGTITEDPNAPLVTFEAPMSAGFVGPDNEYEPLGNNYTVNQATVTLEGTIQDQSAVEYMEITRYYNYRPGGRYRPDAEADAKREIEIPDPGDSFSRELRLGPGRPSVGSGANRLQIEVADEYGNVRQYHTQITVNDTAAPEINVLDRRPVATRSAVEVSAEVTDSVGISSIGVRDGPVTGAGQDVLFTQRQPLQRPFSKTVTTTVPILDGTKAITLIATDQANHRTTRELAVNYSELVTPAIQFDNSLTGTAGAQRVQAVGRVYDGQISRVRVESLTPDGETIDINSVYSGGVTENVSFQELLDAEAYPAAVRVRVLDVTGTEHTKTIELSQSEPVDEVVVEGAGTETETAGGEGDQADRTTLRNIESSPAVSPGTADQSGPLGTLTGLVSEYALPIVGLLVVVILLLVVQQRRG